jgi:hypothetical protein
MVKGRPKMRQVIIGGMVLEIRLEVGMVQPKVRFVAGAFSSLFLGRPKNVGTTTILPAIPPGAVGRFALLVLIVLVREWTARVGEFIGNIQNATRFSSSRTLVETYHGVHPPIWISHQDYWQDKIAIFLVIFGPCIRILEIERCMLAPRDCGVPNGSFGVETISDKVVIERLTKRRRARIPQASQFGQRIFGDAMIVLVVGREQGAIVRTGFQTQYHRSVAIQFHYLLPGR